MFITWGMVVCASEDIGLADNTALLLVSSRLFFLFLKFIPNLSL